MGREPAVSGVFYKADAAGLKQQVLSLLGAGASTTNISDVVAIVAPHAAYAYSGSIMGQTYSHVVLPRTVVVIGPNHTGLGKPCAVGTQSPWITPLGEVEVDIRLAMRLLRTNEYFSEDDLGHLKEHSIEVHLPFLQVLNPNVKFVPICLRALPYNACKALGEAIASVLSQEPDPALLVASSDLNHHEPLAVATRKDKLVLDRMMELDAKGLYDAVVAHHVSMCGFVPTVVVMVAAQALGACYAHLVAYGTSADVDGDTSAVVGYAGLLFTRKRPRAPSFRLTS